MSQRLRTNRSSSTGLTATVTRLGASCGLRNREGRGSARGRSAQDMAATSAGASTTRDPATASAAPVMEPESTSRTPLLRYERIARSSATRMPPAASELTLRPSQPSKEALYGALG